MTENPEALLRAYDEQLRRDAEVQGAVAVTEDGPLVRAVFPRGGFVSYASLEQVDDLDALVDRTIAHFRDETELDEFEWKTRGHDQPVDLTERLLAHGFVAEEVETVMAGSVDHLVTEVDLPDGVRVRRAGDGGDFTGDVTRAAALQREVFGDGPTPEQVLDRLARSDGEETLWLAESGDQVICAGRLAVVPGTEFAGLWGGATHPDWRGHGIYRALTAARARYARTHGVRYLQSDCSPMSRPILERSGLVAITTTTPYIWRRGAQSGA